MSIFGGDSKGLNNSSVSMTNIETRELKNFGGSDRQKSFRQAVNTRIGPSLVDLSRDLFGNGVFSSKHESSLKAGFQRAAGVYPNSRKCNRVMHMKDSHL